MSRSIARSGTAVAACLLLAACRGGDGGDTTVVRSDTGEARWEEGLSAQEVEAEARALSPEEAEAQGLVVDTTIHLEVRDADDTVFVPRANEPTPAPVPTTEEGTPVPRP
jgi:hypothetical protein